MRQRVAVFVDGENVGAKHADGISRLACERGEILLARVYGDINQLNGWCGATRFTAVHSGTGKNAADILLALDAFDLARDGRFDTCVLCSSDHDFSHLAVKLRERGVRVVGAGEPKAPKRFSDQCSEFVYLGRTCSVDNAATPSISPEPMDELDGWIRNAVTSLGEDGSIRITVLNADLHQRHGFCVRQLSGASWQAFIHRRSDRYEHIPGQEPRLRLRAASEQG